MKFRPYLFAVLAVLPAWLTAQTAQIPQPGVLHSSVTVLADASQSYALYLPAHYSSEKKWPVLMAFDPGGNGAEPVKAFQQAAEKFGYIVAGSNNSRNFADPTEAVRLFSGDVFNRYAIDKRRVYLTGFSGGARVAASIAMNCKGCVAGVIACGAGLPNGSSVSGADVTDWYLTAGTTDFNLREVTQLAEELKSKHAAVELTFFEGPHSWLPPALAEEALAWMQLRAMARGTLPQDQEFITTEYAKRMKQAEMAREQNQPLDALRDYEQAAADFQKLRATDDAEKAARDLGHSGEVRKARKNLNASLELEEKVSKALETTIHGLIERQGPSGLLLEQLQSQLYDARRDQEGSRDAGRRDAIARGIAGSFAFAIETGQSDMKKKDYTGAKDLFSACAILKSDSPWPHLLLARAHAAMNEKKAALDELRRALANGLNQPHALDSPEFDRLRDDPGFQELATQASSRGTD